MAPFELMTKSEPSTEQAHSTGRRAPSSDEPTTLTTNNPVEAGTTAIEEAQINVDESEKRSAEPATMKAQKQPSQNPSDDALPAATDQGKALPPSPENRPDDKKAVGTSKGSPLGSQTRNPRPDPFSAPLTHPNGVSMFPELSASEQESISRQALAQAEGWIEVDIDEVNSIADGTTDAGYESDPASTTSTSIESSVRDYLYENGRRYHRFREGFYNFPNDDVEQEREDMKHAMVKLLCNQKLHCAPIGEFPHEVLDIGTRTGVWAIEMGDEYASSNVMGVDLSPIQPDWLPPNVRFMIDDVESTWLYPRNHFDYIHSRHTVMAIKDWPRLFGRAIEHIKPGGWMELQEIDHRPYSAQIGGSIPPEHPVAQYWKLISEGLRALGVDFHAATGGRMANMMRDAGFVNVTERVFHVPIGTWPKNKVLKTVGLYWRTILADGLQAIALGPLTRGLQWSRDEVELFLISVRKAYAEDTNFMYMPLHIVYGQKPLDAC